MDAFTTAMALPATVSSTLLPSNESKAEASFRIVAVNARHTAPRDTPVGGKVFQIPWSFELENTSLFWADPLRIGMVAWSLEDAESGVSDDDEIRRHVDARRPVGLTPLAERLVLTHTRNMRSDNSKFKLDPFERGTLQSLAATNVWLPPLQGRTNQCVELSAALYILSKGMLPQWFQLRCTYSYSELRRTDPALGATCEALPRGTRPAVQLIQPNPLG